MNHIWIVQNPNSLPVGRRTHPALWSLLDTYTLVKQNNEKDGTKEPNKHKKNKMGLFDLFQRKRCRILHFTISLTKTKLIFCFEKVCMLSTSSLRPSSPSILRHPWMPKEEREWSNKLKKHYCGHSHPLQRQMPLPSHVLIFGCFFSGCWWGFGVLKLVAMEVWGGLSSWKPTFAHSVRKTTCRAASKANEEKCKLF